MRALELIKDRIKRHTLFDEIGGVILWKTGWANKYMSGINSMYKTYRKLDREFKNEIGSRELKEYSCEDKSNTIWICWLQGIEDAPRLVKECFASVKKHCGDMEVVVISKDNLAEYTELPDYIIDKWQRGIITHTHFSDILRMNILLRHGGLWLDATTFLTDELPSYITDSDFFVYRNGFFDEEMINMGSWLIYSKPNNKLLLETQALIFSYWKKHNYLRNYFLMHIFFRMVTDKYKELWDKVPYYNQIDNHILANEFTKKYDEKRFEQIKACTSVHKLTNKIDKLTFEEDSYYDRLSQLY